MSLQPEALPPVPEETARIAKVLFPKGNTYMWLRDELEAIYTDEQFRSLYPQRGQLAEQPWRLALMSVIQYMEHWTDRQAAEALKTRIDLKYVCSLELTDPGFHFSVLSEFRSRLIQGGGEDLLLNGLLTLCRQKGWLKERGKQRTDSTHIEAAIRQMNRFVNAVETLRAALNTVAIVAPDWLRRHAPADWYDRYDTRVEEFHIPKDEASCVAMMQQVGQDGYTLLNWSREEDAPTWLREIPALETLRQVWVQQFLISDGHVAQRSKEDTPAAARLIISPYDREARMSIKRETAWTGYKVHLTETCDEDQPHLILHVETTPATTPDKETVEDIHQALAQQHLLPAEHVVDMGYVDAHRLLTSQQHYGIELLGPVVPSGSWQARTAQAYDKSQFEIHWEEEFVVCPEGKTSKKWTVKQHPDGRQEIRARFGDTDCRLCSARSLCTRATVNPRQIVLSTREQYEALEAARHRQTSKDFQERYAIRAGIEGTISQGTRVCDLRTARYRGMTKTHLQHVLTAVALNVKRIFHWEMDAKQDQPRLSRFAALAA